MSNPKLFISYSWTNDEHQTWVIGLANELVENGIDVVLDVWEVKPGNDLHAYMEQMVTNNDIHHVLMVFNKTYANKADDREGGVGTETTIITPNIYNNTRQTKFVAIATEYDENGEPYSPAFYRSRLWISMPKDENYSAGVEKIIRWVYDKPLHIKPKIGKKPKYLEEDSKSSNFRPSSLYYKALIATKDHQKNADTLCNDFLQEEAESLEMYRIPNEVVALSDALLKSLEDYKPKRDHIITIIETMLIFNDCESTRITIHKFFETCLKYNYHMPHVNPRNDHYLENFEIIIHELFLHVIALMIKREKYDAADHLLANDFFIRYGGRGTQNQFIPFRDLRRYSDVLEQHNTSNKLGQISFHAGLLVDRVNLAVGKEDLLQADFALFIRDALHSKDYDYRWWPQTLLYADRHHGAFEMWARSRSLNYLVKAGKVIGLESIAQIKSLVSYFDANPEKQPRWEFERIDIRKLIGVDDLATRR